MVPQSQLELDREIASAALRREAERLRVAAVSDHGLLATILNHSPHGIVVCDGQGRLTLVNHAAERICGGAAAGGRLDWSRCRAIHPDGLPFESGDWPLARALRDGAAVETEEIEIERIDGSRAVLLGSTAPIPSRDGGLQGAVSVFADITRFKETERALLARERGTADRLARLHAFTAALSEAADLAEVARVTVEHGRAALGAAAGGLWLATPGSDPALLHESGVPEPLADAFRRVPAAADAPVALAVRDGAASWIGSRRQLDRRWPRLGACLAPHLPDDLSFACAPLEVRAGRIGAVLFAYRAPRAFDGDERALLLALARQAAQALERARLYDAERRAHADAEAARARMGALYADAQRAIRARDDVLAIVSHDLRNPLHAIVMASSLLGDATSRPERVRAHAAAIERSARRMNRLIRDLLDSSRLEAGRLTLERQPTLAGSLLGEAAALILPMAGEKEIVVSIAPGAEALEVRCDRERILQVLANLLGNAVTFTPPGGEIALEAAGLPEGGARFAVRDTGIGVPAEHQALIFDRYWKSRESRQGTGLGLAIAKGIVEAHGGRIWVESRAGEGATFRFTVPP